MSNEPKPDDSRFEFSGSQVGSVNVPRTPPGDESVKPASNKVGLIGVAAVTALIAAAGIARALGWI